MFIRSATIVIISLFFNQLSAKDIPIIVITPSKTPQSVSSVGTSVTIISEDEIENSGESFLGNVLDINTSGNSFFQTGGPGTQMGIQLRGLPKAYSAIFIDGVRTSDASTPKNDFYFDDILAGQVNRVEILKGNQSSIYGSGALGGVVNIFSKRGLGDFKKKIDYQTGSNQTHNLGFSYEGSNDYKDFYIGLEKYQTNGISAMNHNDEKDPYKNHTFLTNYGYKFSEDIDIRTIYKITDSKLNYDAVNAAYDQSNNSSHEIDTLGIVDLNFKVNEKLNNNFKISTTYMRRHSDNVKSAFDPLIVDQEYWSYRDTIGYTGNYKINKNNNMVFGAEKEFEEMRYSPSDTIDFKTGEEITSQYLDIQSKLTEKLYTTIGIRFDEHSKAGNEDSERFTVAYLSDLLGAKIKSSYGSGVKFPSLYEYYNSSSPNALVAEHGRSYDIGIEKSFLNQGINIELVYFNTKYEDTIEGWMPEYTAANRDGEVRTQGLEFSSYIKPAKDLSIGLNYTYTSTFDGADFSNLDYANETDFTNSQMVRVPRHLLNLRADYNFPNNLKMSLLTKYSDTVRDYGNVNVAGGNNRDVRLDNYIVSDLGFNYKLLDYNSFFKMSNIFDKNYNTANQFSMLKRTFNIGLKKIY